MNLAQQISEMPRKKKRIRKFVKKLIHDTNYKCLVFMIKRRHRNGFNYYDPIWVTLTSEIQEELVKDGFHIRMMRISWIEGE